MATGATSISSLPVNPASGNPNGNTVIQRPNPQSNMPQQRMPPQQMPQQRMSQQQMPPQQMPQQQMPQQQMPQQQMPPQQMPQQQMPNTQYTNNFDIKSNHDPNMHADTMNKLTKDLAAAKNTKLPPQHIPKNIQRLVQDKQTKPNFVPAPKKEMPDFVKNYETTQSLKESHAKKEEKKETIDVLYEELQAPVLIGFLFFVFQLPFVRKRVSNVLPFLFLKDGNMNMSGFVVLSMVFGILYYAIQKGLKQFSTIKI